MTTSEERLEQIYRVARAATYTSDETSVDLAVDALIEAGFISLTPTVPAVEVYVVGCDPRDADNSPPFKTLEEAEAERSDLEANFSGPMHIYLKSYAPTPASMKLIA